MVKIIDAMVAHYFMDVFLSYIDDHNVAPDEVSEYDPYIENVRSNAAHYKHFEYLQLGIAHLLGQPNMSFKNWLLLSYPWKEQALREGIEYMYKELWPDAGPIPPGGPAGVEVVPCPWDVWNVTMPGALD